MPEHILHGCQSKPLASYLKSLGILRLVSEQCDSSARGSWQDGCFRLSCRLDEAALLRFFLAEYRPSPLVSPWNGGSGFYPGDNKEGIDAVAKSEDERLVVYRRAIASIFAWPEFQEIYALPAAKRKARGEEVKKNKEAILQRCRSQLPEECLPWLDAAYACAKIKPSSLRSSALAATRADWNSPTISCRKSVNFFWTLRRTGRGHGSEPAFLMSLFRPCPK